MKRENSPRKSLKMSESDKPAKKPRTPRPVRAKKEAPRRSAGEVITSAEIVEELYDLENDPNAKESLVKVFPDLDLFRKLISRLLQSFLKIVKLQML